MKFQRVQFDREVEDVKGTIVGLFYRSEIRASTCHEIVEVLEGHRELQFLLAQEGGGEVLRVTLVGLTW